jgi:hypothetical protein
MTSRRYTIGTALAYAERLADRASWYSGGALQRGRVAGRHALARWGVPLRREFLELGCARGNEASGVFSEVCAVLGSLDHVERYAELYAGLAVDFGVDGLYYERAAGPNWWTYYFEPIALGTRAAARRRAVPLWQHDAFAESIERSMTRAAAATLASRHLRVTPAVQDAADAFWREHVGNAPAIGVHYRGTDKHEESPRVPYDAVVSSIRDRQHVAGGAPIIFLATDELACVDHMRAAFGDRLVAREVLRSADGRPVHKHHGGRRAGLEAVIDCVLLAKAHEIVRTASNLGLVASLMNPTMPETVVRA